MPQYILSFHRRDDLPPVDRRKAALWATDIMKQKVTEGMDHLTAEGDWFGGHVAPALLVEGYNWTSSHGGGEIGVEVS
jgi:hypothetical protein